jgi:hypothetical protein
LAKITDDGMKDGTRSIMLELPRSDRFFLFLSLPMRPSLAVIRANRRNGRGLGTVLARRGRADAGEEQALELMVELENEASKCPRSQDRRAKTQYLAVSA